MAGCETCEAVYLSRSPHHARQAVYRRVKDRHGELAAMALMQRVGAVYRGATR